MPKDRDERPADTVEGDEEKGATDGRKGQSAVPGEGRSDEDAPDTVKEVQIALVDDILEAEKITDQEVADRVAPSTTLTEITPEATTVSESTIRASKTKQRVDTVVEPEQELAEDTESVQITTVAGIEGKKTTQSAVHTVRPHQKLEENHELTVATVQDLTVDKTTQAVDQVMTAQQHQGKEPLELEEEDPVFRWSGGSPYGSGKPKLVIHRAQEEVPSLPFLQVLLRDTYKELEGGEPGADTVEFVANEPRIPQVQKNIVTLDVTEDGWTSSMRNDRPVIERNGVDIVPKLREAASTLYAGKLGYLVVNIPSEWEGDVLQADFFKKLVKRLAGTETIEAAADEGTVFEQVKSAPVVVAEPSVSNSQELFRKVTDYYALSGGVDRIETVEQVEEVQEQVLRREDWKRIALTKRQRGEDESDEHYFWKAAIAEGLAREMKRCYNAGRSADKRESFERFMKEKLLPGDVIESEYPVSEGNDKNKSVIADLLVDNAPGWQQDGVNAFIGRDGDVTSDVIIEFETGRSEGAFNFRKIRETLEKYTESGVNNRFICVVVPPRLLFRGKRRAKMIVELVDSWNEVDADSGLAAGIFVPVIGNRYCEQLKTASTTIAELYGDQDE